MKINRKVIESAAVAAFALVVAVTAATVGNTKYPADSYPGEALTNETETQAATKEKAEREMVSAASRQKAAEDTLAVTGAEAQADARAREAAEAPAAEPASPWAAKLMPNVEKSLNIRAEGNAESEVVGKLYRGAVADILERGREWSKISSGSVEGYVKNEYCVFEAEAEAMANELGTVKATATAGGLRVRAEADTAEETAIVDVLEEGEKLKVDTGIEAPAGWVAVLVKDATAYVSAEYVTVELELGKAVSIEEELAAIKKAEEEKAAKEAAQRKAEQAKGAETSRNEAAAASYDNVTLLGALIQCEAGGEPYEGQVAVGAVVMNRLRAGFGGGTLRGVIYERGQFSPVSSGSLERRLQKGVSASCMQAAQEALAGADNVNGALYFKRAESGQAGIVICCHVFY